MLSKNPILVTYHHIILIAGLHGVVSSVLLLPAISHAEGKKTMLLESPFQGKLD